MINWFNFSQSFKMSSIKTSEAVPSGSVIKSSLAEVYQALLSGCVSCPESLVIFLEEKIMKIRGNGIHGNESDWPLPVCSIQKISVGSPCGSQVLSSLFEKAHSWCRKRLTKMCFKAWRGYVSTKRETAAERALKMSGAAERHSQRVLRTALHGWATWLQVRRRRQQEAVRKLRRVWNSVHCRAVLQAWHRFAQESRKTKENLKLDTGPCEKRDGSCGVPHMDWKDVVSMLPWKLALKILQYLPVRDLLRCAQVSHSWKAITQMSSLWGKINFSVEKDHVEDSAAVRILQRYRPFVVHLNMRGCSALQWPSFECAAKCRNLLELNISECKAVNDETVRVIVEGCPSLLYLNLSHTAVTDTTIRNLSRCCLSLQYLSLAYCRNFTDRGLQYLTTGKGCHRLVHLDLSGCTQISVDGFRDVAVGCSQLQHFELNDMPTIVDKCVLVMVSRCSSLNAVSFLDTPHLSDTAFKAIAEGCRLQWIRIEGNSQMTDGSWRHLTRNCPGLRFIHVVDCPQLSDASMRSIGSLKNLTSLSVADCRRMSDVGLRYLLEGPPGPKLCSLNLSSCERVGDMSLVRLAQRCSSLRHLDLSYCERLTDTGLECLGLLSSLVSLDLTGTNIQDQGLASLGSIAALRNLSVSKCPWITDAGIEKLCEEARDLESLDLSHCLVLSNQTVKALCCSCRNLLALRVRGCPKMTDMAIQYLTGVSHYLRELDVSGCVHLTERTPKLLQRSCQQLACISMLYCTGIPKQAALLLRPRAQQWEHSRDSVPPWYGYSSEDQLLQPMKMEVQCEGHQETDREQHWGHSCHDDHSRHGDHS
ncbi:dynein regulatory complex subunit 6 [Brienomyrus brachyistius]|uniref:dynein regulatory complex subunit 6 n=1 Tax=Brienomyrus brachyistius TaxID=42636 RepID=UPI0020B44861|nr:dynein regulatory complex subunit 6 [Brienomyrus brachyistius]